MRKMMMVFLSFFALVSVGMYFAPQNASAFPGFARKYNFPCTFCHIQWPKLADNGNFFKDRGFMLSTTGKGNGLDMMFQDPKQQNYFPIGFHMSMSYGVSTYNGVANGPGFTAGAPSTFTGPISNNGFAMDATSNTNWDIESGGLLNPWISFWVQPGFGGGGGAFGIVKLWVRFNDLLNTTWLNIYAGKTSQDVPFSNQRALNIDSGAPYTMYDYQPGRSEIVNNGIQTAGNLGPMTVSAFYDADALRMLNDHTAIRYFGYHINGGNACATQSGFSIDPCETRVSVSFIPNTGLYGGTEGSFANAGDSAIPNSPFASQNGFSYFIHATQSFGGWGVTNGERIGAFAYIGESSSVPTGANAASANAVFNRIGFDLSTNPIPNGGLNIFGAWEIVNDPAGAIATNTTLTGGTASYATSGLEYMTWFIEADWQPTFGGFFSQSGTNSNMILFTYNQLNMMQQPQFAGVTQQLPGNFNNVVEFDVMDRYWLWGSDRADISLFASWQWMINYGMGSLATQSGSTLQGYGSGSSAASPFSSGGFYNAEANNFTVGLDFAY